MPLVVRPIPNNFTAVNTFYALSRYSVLIGTSLGQIWELTMSDHLENPIKKMTLVYYLPSQERSIQDLKIDDEGRILFVDQFGMLSVLDGGEADIHLGKIESGEYLLNPQQ